MSEENILALVKESKAQDISRGIVRIDPDLLQKLNIKVGDAVQLINVIEGRKTAALAWPADGSPSTASACRTPQKRAPDRPNAPPVPPPFW